MGYSVRVFGFLLRKVSKLKKLFDLPVYLFPCSLFPLLLRAMNLDADYSARVSATPTPPVTSEGVPPPDLSTGSPCRDLDPEQVRLVRFNPRITTLCYSRVARELGNVEAKLFRGRPTGRSRAMKHPFKIHFSKVHCKIRLPSLEACLLEAFERCFPLGQAPPPVTKKQAKRQQRKRRSEETKKKERIWMETQDVKPEDEGLVMAIIALAQIPEGAVSARTGKKSKTRMQWKVVYSLQSTTLEVTVGKNGLGQSTLPELQSLDQNTEAVIKRLLRRVKEPYHLSKTFSNSELYKMQDDYPEIIVTYVNGIMTMMGETRLQVLLGSGEGLLHTIAGHPIFLAKTQSATGDLAAGFRWISGDALVEHLEARGVADGSLGRRKAKKMVAKAIREILKIKKKTLLEFISMGKVSSYVAKTMATFPGGMPWRRSSRSTHLFWSEDQMLPGRVIVVFLCLPQIRNL